MIVVVTIWVISLWIAILTHEAVQLLHRIRRKRQMLYTNKRSRKEMEKDKRVPVWVHVRIAKIERQYEKRLLTMQGNK